MFLGSRNPLLIFLQSYHVWVTSKIQVDFRFNTYSEVLVIVSCRVLKFLHYLCFWGQGIHCWHSYWATMFEGPRNSGQLPVREVFVVTQTFVPWQKCSKFISSHAKDAGRSNDQCFIANCIVMSRHVMSRHVTSCHVMSRPVSCHVTSCHVMSRYITPCHVMSRPAMSRDVTSYHVMPRHAMSCHVLSHPVTSCRVTFRHVMPRHVKSCHVMSRHTTSCHAMSRHVTSCHVMSRHVTLYHAMSRHVTSCHVTSCHVMSSHVKSCHVMPRCVTSCHVTSCHVVSRPVMSCHVGCPEGCRFHTASAVYSTKSSFIFLSIFFFFIHRSFSETTWPILTKFSGIVYSGVVWIIR